MLVRSKTLFVAAGLLTAAVAGFCGVAASEHVESEMLATESAVPVEEGMVDVAEMEINEIKSGYQEQNESSDSRSRSDPSVQDGSVQHDAFENRRSEQLKAYSARPFGRRNKYTFSVPARQKKNFLLCCMKTNR